MPVPCSPGMRACPCHAVPGEAGRRGHRPALGVWTHVYAAVRMLISVGAGAPPFQKLSTALSGGQSAALPLRLDSLPCEQSWQAQRASMPLTPRTPCDTLKNSLLLRSPHPTPNPRPPRLPFGVYSSAPSGGRVGGYFTGKFHLLVPFSSTPPRPPPRV